MEPRICRKAGYSDGNVHVTPTNDYLFANSEMKMAERMSPYVKQSERHMFDCLLKN